MSTIKQKIIDTLFVSCIVCLLTIGLFLILSPWLKEIVIKNSISSYQIQHFTMEEIEKNATNTNFENELSTIETPSLTTVMKNINKVNRTNVIGEIAIPDVHLLLPILKGTNTPNLLVGATTLKENQKMEEGNYVLAGHHMREETMLFGPLLYVQKGTVIQLTDKQNLYTYQVVEKKIVHESETDILNDTPYPFLTLFTCDISGPTNKRLVVTAELINTTSMNEENKHVKKYQKLVNIEKGKDIMDFTFLVWIIAFCCILLFIVLIVLYFRKWIKNNKQ
ncbi:class A sortase [Bacillus cereus]|nr:class A sortase [Bacillus cereus]PGU64248.1 class A sortase [Bacillus cereus]